MSRLTMRHKQSHLAIPEEAYANYCGDRELDCASFCNTQIDCIECPIGACFDKLAEYEDAEEQGRLIEFPVAIGDHLWQIDDYGIIKEMLVGELVQTRKNGQTMLADTMGLRAYYPLDLIGKKIFYTREEAEAKLKELG